MTEKWLPWFIILEKQRYLASVEVSPSAEPGQYQQSQILPISAKRSGNLSIFVGKLYLKKLLGYTKIIQDFKINIVTLAIGCVADLTLRHAALREAAAAAIDHAQANGAWKASCWPIVV